MANQEIPRSLADYIVKVGSAPFSWGTNDCVLFVCGWIQKQTGKNLLEDLPLWHNQTSAYRVLAQVGGLEEVAKQRLGMLAKIAKTGDIAYLLPPHNCMGIVSGNGILVISKTGLIKLGLPTAKHIWEL